MSGLTPTELEQIEAATSGRCSDCLRPLASDDDWEKYADDEGQHLCWETPGTCGWHFETTTTDLLAPAVDTIATARAEAALLDLSLKFDGFATEWAEEFAASNLPADEREWRCWELAAFVARDAARIVSTLPTDAPLRPSPPA